MGGAGRIAAGIGTGGLSEVYRASGGKGGGAPSAPDFANMAERQGASAHIDQSNPFGSTGWTQGPDGRWTQNTQLSGGLAQGAQNLEGQIASGSQLSPQDTRDQAIQGAYGMQTSRLDPQFAQARESTQAQLANQGLSPGSQAYDNAMGNFGRQQNDAYQQALLSAQSGAGNTAFGQSLAANNQPYQQLNALNGLTSGLSGVGPQTQFLPAASQQYAGALQGYGIDQAKKNSQMSGLGSLGGMALLASDESLKTEIERLPVEALPGVPFASWRWKKGGRGFGVIAQDVERVRPDLVHRHPDGYLMVDYSFLDR